MSSMLPACAAAKAWLSLLSLRYPARLFLPLGFTLGCCRCCWGAPRRPYCCSCICWLGLGPLSTTAGLGLGLAIGWCEPWLEAVAGFTEPLPVATALLTVEESVRDVCDWASCIALECVLFGCNCCAGTTS
jgi:hypothetical protein